MSYSNKHRTFTGYILMSSALYILLNATLEKVPLSNKRRTFNGES